MQSTGVLCICALGWDAEVSSKSRDAEHRSTMHLCSWLRCRALIQEQRYRAHYASVLLYDMQITHPRADIQSAGVFCICALVWYAELIWAHPRADMQSAGVQKFALRQLGQQLTVFSTSKSCWWEWWWWQWWWRWWWWWWTPLLFPFNARESKEKKGNLMI